MKLTFQIIGALYGGLSVMFGAFGAHALKQILSPEKLQSFETGVKYQMYHALVLLIIGFFFNFSSSLEKWMGWSFTIGTFLFSFSIYFLALSSIWNVKLSFLGPITPLGGLFLIVGWVLLILSLTTLR